MEERQARRHHTTNVTPFKLLSNNKDAYKTNSKLAKK